ncbi:MAG: phosphatidate cytidylyltransferase [Raineya sp.]
MSNLAQRIIAGVLGAAMLINAIYWSQWSFFLVFAFIMSFCLWEFYTLLEKAGHKVTKKAGLMVGNIIFFGVFFVQKVQENEELLLCVVLVAAFSLFVLKLYDKDDREPFLSLAFTVLGILYVAIPFGLLLEVSYLSDIVGRDKQRVIFGEVYKYQVPLGILFCLWASDSGAYFVGRKLGKTKLFERISPKKTWEGLAGGMFFSQMVAWGLAVYFTSLEAWKWFAISTIMVIVGTYGDLVESMFKRSLAIKDSGSVIPGHGGFLDRFDGLLVAMPFVALFLKLFT